MIAKVKAAMASSFRRRKPAVSRADLVAACAALAAAQERLAAAQERRGRLDAIIAAEAPARAAVQHAVAADGAAALSRLARRQDKTGDLAALIAAAEAATRAAAVAQGALSAAEAELQDAGLAVGAAEVSAGKAVRATLTALAEPIGAEYVRAVAKVAALHEQLFGADRALGGALAFAAPSPIEVPGFKLAAVLATMPSGGAEYSPVLRRLPRGAVIAMHANAWGAAAKRLRADPHADVAGLIGGTEKPAAGELVQSAGLVRQHRPDDPAHAVPPDYREIKLSGRATGLLPVAADDERARPPMRVIGR